MTSNNVQKFDYGDGFYFELSTKPRNPKNNNKTAGNEEKTAAGPINVSKDVLSCNHMENVVKQSTTMKDRNPTTAGVKNVQSTSNSRVPMPKQQHMKTVKKENNEGQKTCSSSTSGLESQIRKMPPPVTLEDWKIFRQHLDIPKKREMVECVICSRTVDFELEAYELNCGHKFCKICIIDEINENHDKFGMVRCLNQKCEKIIDDEEIHIILGDEEFKNFMTKISKILNENAEKLKHDKKVAEELENENLNYLKNKQEFECQICFMEVPPGDGVIIKECRHEFCIECLNETVKHSENLQVLCPHNDGTKNCDTVIQEREIRGFATPEILEKHLEKSIKLYEATNNSTTVHCKTTDCKGFVEVEKNVQVRGFQCVLCQQTNCLGCKAIHTGKNCEEYQDSLDPEGGRRKREERESENTIKNLIAAGQAMYCPRCKIPVMKDQGCDWICCTTCKLGICWVTKKPRQPTMIDGVLIDGCHCREGGKRCHPNCGFCH